jgi:hypothetical protein
VGSGRVIVIISGPLSRRQHPFSPCLAAGKSVFKDGRLQGEKKTSPSSSFTRTVEWRDKGAELVDINECVPNVFLMCSCMER